MKRRNFFKTLGILGAAVAIPKIVDAAPEDKAIKELEEFAGAGGFRSPMRDFVRTHLETYENCFSLVTVTKSPVPYEDGYLIGLDHSVRTGYNIILPKKCTTHQADPLCHVARSPSPGLYYIVLFLPGVEINKIEPGTELIVNGSCFSDKNF